MTEDTRDRRWHEGECVRCGQLGAVDAETRLDTACFVQLADAVLHGRKVTGPGVDAVRARFGLLVRYDREAAERYLHEIRETWAAVVGDQLTRTELQETASVLRRLADVVKGYAERAGEPDPDRMRHVVDLTTVAAGCEAAAEAADDPAGRALALERWLT
ncbi:MAG: hypothetical protein OXJ54_07990 [Gemmatimonadetes bacterium]|nr:hypothetical protein [Candidatus Palauibacter rhopaloidicola]